MFPETEGDPDSTTVYMCANSLGLKPKSADTHMKEALDNWGRWGVFSHFNSR